MDGPRLRQLPPVVYAAHRITGEAGVTDATDDWPFLYLKSPGVSDVYIRPSGLSGCIGAVAIVLSLGGRGLRRFDAALFFTGLAFLLLEAKSIVNFTLLFGGDVAGQRAGHHGHPVYGLDRQLDQRAHAAAPRSACSTWGWA